MLATVIATMSCQRALGKLGLRRQVANGRTGRGVPKNAGISSPFRLFDSLAAGTLDCEEHSCDKLR